MHMANDHIAQSTITVNAPAREVWVALTNPEIIKQYFFGVDTVSDWHVGSSIVWRGEWKGKSFEDKGEILKIDEEQVLQYTHYSPLSGKPEIPENYHTVTIELESKNDNETAITISQDNNPTEGAREHSKKNWDMMLEGLKKTVEK